MSMFPSIEIAGTGLGVDQVWIDTIGGNVANAQDAVTPGQPVYRDQQVQATPVPNAVLLGQSNAGNGVEITGIALGSGTGVLTYDPTNPLANSKGDVVYPNVNIGHEMTSLVEAQANYEANATVLQNSDTAYKAILAIKP